MKDLSYPLRPAPSAIYSAPSAVPSKPITETLNNFGLSEMLTLLLGMTLSGGFVNRTLFSLLKDIFPYAEQHDKKIISRMLGIDRIVNTPASPPSKTAHSVLTSTERLLGMLKVLRKYSIKETSDRFTMFERFIRMQQKLNSSGGDLMPFVFELMGAGGETANILRMMNQFKNL